MRNTWDVPENTTAERIIERVAAVARVVPGGKFCNVVFSCHGAPAEMRCCRVAYIAGAGPAATNDGNTFCSRMAQASSAYVVASTELQAGADGRELPYGKLDTYEGLVLSYGPSGNITWQHRYRSTYRSPGHFWGLIPETYHENPD